MNVAELPIKVDREKVAEFYCGRGIRKLRLFGLVLRDDFRHFGFAETFSVVIGVKVEFCSRLNNYIAAAVRQ